MAHDIDRREFLKHTGKQTLDMENGEPVNADDEEDDTPAIVKLARIDRRIHTDIYDDLADE